MPSTPVVLSMLACDHIWRDPATGKWALLGVFEWLHSDRQPLEDVALEVYVQMTNLHGAYDLELAVVSAHDEHELARYALGGRIHAHDPLRRLQVGFCLSRLSLPAHGKYLLRLLASGRALHDIVLWALPEGDEP
ncbi:MAG: DUF6941 family protein [Planctomycetia bacterium]